MQHPGDTWTIASALALAAWGVGGTQYLKHRLLAPVRTGAARAKHQAELAQSTPYLLGKKLLLSKARGHTTANTRQLQRAEHWQKRVYLPVSYALSTSTLVLAVWGVMRGS